MASNVTYCPSSDDTDEDDEEKDNDGLEDDDETGCASWAFAFWEIPAVVTTNVTKQMIETIRCFSE